MALVEEKSYTIDQVAKILDISRTTAYQMVKSGEINSIKIRSIHKIYESHIEEFLKSNEYNPEKAAQEKAEKERARREDDEATADAIAETLGQGE